jgi:hypothetical protein
MAADSFLKAGTQKLFFEMPFSKWSEMDDDRQLPDNERKILFGGFKTLFFSVYLK